MKEALDIQMRQSDLPIRPSFTGRVVRNGAVPADLLRKSALNEGEPARTADIKIAGLDKTDVRILRVVQSEPNISIMRLAEQVGLSHTPCWRRLRRLEKDGIIAGRVALLNPDKLGLKINVFAKVQLTRHDEHTLERFEQAAQDCVEVVECFSVSGDRDYMLRIVMRSVEEYEQFLRRVLLHLPGVASVNSTIALKRVKVTTRLPI